MNSADNIDKNTELTDLEDIEIRHARGAIDELQSIQKIDSVIGVILYLVMLIVGITLLVEGAMHIGIILCLIALMQIYLKIFLYKQNKRIALSLLDMLKKSKDILLSIKERR